MSTLIDLIRSDKAQAGDVDTLREVDFRVFCMSEALEIKTHKDNVYCNHPSQGLISCNDGRIPNYSTSLDAQVELKPDGWTWGVGEWLKGWDADLTDSLGTEIGSEGVHKTEALARLDALIQVMEGGL